MSRRRDQNEVPGRGDIWRPATATESKTNGTYRQTDDTRRLTLDTQYCRTVQRRKHTENGGTGGRTESVRSFKRRRRLYDTPLRSAACRAVVLPAKESVSRRAVLMRMLMMAIAYDARSWPT